MLTDTENICNHQEKEEKEQHKAKEQRVAVQNVSDEDVTDELFKDQDANANRNLCNTLNKDGIRKRDAALERPFHSAAVAVLRSRVVVDADPIAVKSYMESASKEGLKARTLHMDFSQYPSLTVTGEWSRNLARQPTKDFQKTPLQRICT